MSKEKKNLNDCSPVCSLPPTEKMERRIRPQMFLFLIQQYKEQDLHGAQWILAFL